MASELYETLYEKAMQREHALLERVRRLWNELELSDLQTAIRLGKTFQEVNEDFLDGMTPVARRNGVDLYSGCPNCGDPNCPGGSNTVTVTVKLGDLGNNAILDMIAKLFGYPVDEEPDEEGGN